MASPDYSAVQAAFKSSGIDPKDPNAYAKFGRWLANQPVDLQNKVMGQLQAPSTGKGRGSVEGSQFLAVQQGVNDARKEAYRNGTALPGVDTAGTQIQWGSKEERSQALQDRSTSEATTTREQAAAIDPSQYQVALHQDAGYDPALHAQDFVESEGAATPEQVALQESAINQARTDQTGLNAQRASLEDMTSAINQGGLTAADRARLEQARMERGVQARGAEGAIRQQAEQQGRAGSAASLVMRQEAQQAATNARSQDELQTAALGLNRRDTLMNSRATIGGAVQSAQDALDRFNTEGERTRAKANQDALNAGNKDTYTEQNARDQRNNATRNSAITGSIGYGAGLSDKNTNITNQQEMINKNPDMGARGIIGTATSQNAGIAGLRGAQAGTLEGEQARQDAIDEQNKALLVQGLSAVGGAGASIAGAAIGQRGR